jgi:hypothetical protein
MHDSAVSQSRLDFDTRDGASRIRPACRALVGRTGSHAAPRLHARRWTRCFGRWPIRAGVLLDSLNARNGQSLRELCAGLSMARQSVSKHLAGARSGQPGSGTGAEPAVAEVAGRMIVTALHDDA